MAGAWGQREFVTRRAVGASPPHVPCCLRHKKGRQGRRACVTSCRTLSPSCWQGKQCCCVNNNTLSPSCWQRRGKRGKNVVVSTTTPSPLLLAGEGKTGSVAQEETMIREFIQFMRFTLQGIAIASSARWASRRHGAGSVSACSPSLRPLPFFLWKRENNYGSSYDCRHHFCCCDECVRLFVCAKADAASEITIPHPSRAAPLFGRPLLLPERRHVRRILNRRTAASTVHAP